MNTNSTHAPYTDSASLSNSLDAWIDSLFYDANDGSNQLIGNNESEEVILLGKTKESSNEVGSNKVPVVVPNAEMNGGDRIIDPHDGCSYIGSGESASLDKDQAINVKVGPELKLSAVSTLLIDENGVVKGESGSLDKGQDINVEVGPELNTPVMSTPLIYENRVVNGKSDDDASVFGISQLEKSCLECSLVAIEKTDAPLAPPSVQEETSDDSESVLQLEIVSNTSSTDCKNPDASGSSDFLEKGATEDDLTSNTVDSRSGQLCRIDFLEEIIENARNNKVPLSLFCSSFDWKLFC